MTVYAEVASRTRALAPASTYPPAAIAPSSARPSPFTASVLTVKSTPAIIAAPITAITRPHHTAAGNCTPEIRAASAVQMGVVVTRAIEAATDVIDRLGSQAAQC